MKKRGEVILLPATMGIRCVLALAESRAGRTLRVRLAEAGADIAGTARTGEEMLALVRTEIPDLVVMDMVLPATDALHTLRALRGEPLMVMPSVLMLAPEGAEKIARLLYGEGVCRVLVKPVGLCDVSNAIERLTEDSRMPREGCVRQRVRKCLSDLGFRASHTGTEYLITATRYASGDMRMVASLVTRLYPLIAQRHGVAAESVESCIRRAIEWAWLNGSMDEQHRLFGGITDERRGKPTNGEMIAHLAELLRLKEI